MMSRLATLGRINIPDGVFYPSAAALAALLVAIALLMQPRNASAVITERELVFQGAALADLVNGPGTNVRFDPGHGDGPVARASSVASFEMAGNMSAGVAAFVPDEFETRISGRRVRVEFEVRAAGSGGPDTVRIGYFTTGYGDSGWRELPVSPQYSTISFEWDAPVYDGQEFNEAVGIWPDPQGENREILIRRIRVFLLPDNS
ncbi:MAG TPA: hypothetical protein DF715_09280 [Oceanicaulis sp.]|jgi:hypothetical protein|uniref:Uncharacterized protein n=1 Tax=Glycocaulis albus TaxID=1382801 RepID=A0ABQ1XXE4_9PROT|nr:hypothetical protein [Glycocaulis albus]MBV5259337.1 hypothetical protein [Synechococcus moorigangaii CMS01]GGH05415.1 hypothetical protein GCM10007420_22390 [Glycocaulis albus]HCY55697.1 hypothetical protein [Oceanicaulis sp.]